MRNAPLASPYSRPLIESFRRHRAADAIDDAYADVAARVPSAAAALLAEPPGQYGLCPVLAAVTFDVGMVYSPLSTSV